MKEGGSRGGKAEAWNRGKTKQTDDRIKQQSEKMTGTGNPFYGQHHAQDTLQKISLSKLSECYRLSEKRCRINVFILKLCGYKMTFLMMEIVKKLKESMKL
jgi:hypothetical protein